MSALTELYNTLLYIPILNTLVLFYHVVGDNLGLAIVALTVVLRVVLHPFTKMQFLATKKQQAIQPQLAELKKEYKNKEVYAKKQMELMKQNGINPGAGCIVMLVPILVIFPLYGAFNMFLKSNGVLVDINQYLYHWQYLQFAEGELLNTTFLGINLARPDRLFILPVLAALSQFVLSWFMQKTSKPVEALVKKTPEKSDDIMYTMQNQMMYLMPVMTLVFGYSLPSGLVLYWFISTVAILASYVILNAQYQKQKGLPPAPVTKGKTL